MTQRRAARRNEVDTALRVAAIRLMAERGYEGTSTDDIAREAGVSPRTFFNHFPTKESVALLPEALLPELASDALRARPLGEDVVESLAATAMEMAAAISELAAEAGPDEVVPLTAASIRLLFSERALRRIVLDRRAQMEELVWSILLERGVSTEDLAARVAVSTVVAALYLGVQQWAEADGAEPLVAVVARCLLAAPHPSRIAAGVTTI